MEERIAAIKKAGFDSVCLDFDEKQVGDAVWENQVRLAHKYEPPIEIAHVTWGYDVPAQPSALALSRYMRAVKAAEEFGVSLAIENSVFAAHVCYLLDNIQSPNFGFCYDSGHEFAYTPDTDYLALYADRVIAMHLHDNNGKSDMHAFPFTQGIDWSSKIKQLKTTAYYNRMITLESSFPHDNVYEGFSAAYEVAQKMRAM